jgi:hypothetical protein
MQYEREAERDIFGRIKANCNEFRNVIIDISLLAVVTYLLSIWSYLIESIGGKAVPRNETGG